MTSDNSLSVFTDALSNADKLYQGYLDAARLGDLSDLACGWSETDVFSMPVDELLDLS